MKQHTHTLSLSGLRTVYLAILALSLIVMGCSQQSTPQQQGEDMLVQARTLLVQGKPEAARDTILSLRKRFPAALDARRQAILLMDSVEYVLAEGDSLKQEFYRRKLEHDLKELKTDN